MEVISEELKINIKEQLPQILMRIFSVCKMDKNFPLKEKFNNIENEVSSLEQQIDRKKELLAQTIVLRNDLSKRLQRLRQENFELRSKLLEELGSDIWF